MLLGSSFLAGAQTPINTGSNGKDGAFSPTKNTTINMADHPDGIYQYSSVNIPSSVTVTFIPNANNTPVYWLVQGSCVINGAIYVAAQPPNGTQGGIGGPGGYPGGGGIPPTSGGGPGAGNVQNGIAANASYGTAGTTNSVPGYGPATLAGPVYGNDFLVPLLGGSGGGGYPTLGGGGGGGAILIAAPNVIQLNGNIDASGSGGNFVQDRAGGSGSGGAVRLVAQSIVGTGIISTSGGFAHAKAGNGRVRFDALQVNFGYVEDASFTQGFQPIIIPPSGAGAQLAIVSVGGSTVPTNPSGLISSPDVIVPAQQANPLNIVVQCSGIPLNSSITVFVVPTVGPQVQATALNTTGTSTSSTATVAINLPHGGGQIYAQAILPVGSGSGASNTKPSKTQSYAQTGLTIHGERFTTMEITAALGRKQHVAYVTESGKKYQTFDR